MTLKSKLAAGFLLAAIASLVLTGVGVYGVNKGATALAYIYENQMLPLAALQEMDSAVKEIRFGMAAAVLDKMPETGARNRFREIRGRIFENWANFKKTSIDNEYSEEARAQIGMIDRQIDLFPAFLDKLERAYEKDQRSLVATMLGDEWPAFDRGVSMPASLLLSEMQLEIQRTYESTRINSGQMAMSAIVIFGISLVLGLVAALLLMRSITSHLGGEPAVVSKLAGHIANGKLDNPVTISRGDNGSLMLAMKTMQDNLRAIISDDVGRVLEALSRGDLTEKIGKSYPGAFGKLRDDANSTVEKLRDIISQVKDSSGQINTAAREIAQSNADLSQRTEEQASSLAETASSMGELASTVNQNAENAKQANNLAQGTVGVAEQSGGSVKELVATMMAISESSKKIENIIGVIDGIAFQTNILALNAAVEAARAGDQGRGFAVVAGEVRNLAQRSATAAKEIKSLIGDSVDKVNIGSKQVSDAAEGISDVVTSVQLVSSLMKDNAAAIAEQSVGIAQVSQAITQMDEVTQQNAALVDEAAAAAESMRQQADVLDNEMRAFKLDSYAGGAGVARHAAPVTRALAVPGRGRKHGKAATDTTGDGEWKEF